MWPVQSPACLLIWFGQMFCPLKSVVPALKCTQWSVGVCVPSPPSSRFALYNRHGWLCLKIDYLAVCFPSMPVSFLASVSFFSFFSSFLHSLIQHFFLIPVCPSFLLSVFLSPSLFHFSHSYLAFLESFRQ